MCRYGPTKILTKGTFDSGIWTLVSRLVLYRFHCTTILINNTLLDAPLLLAMTVYPIYISGHKSRQKHHLSFKSTAKRSVEKTPTTDLQQLRREKILKSVSKVSETRTTARKKIQNKKQQPELDLRPIAQDQGNTNWDVMPRKLRLMLFSYIRVEVVAGDADGDGDGDIDENGTGVSAF